MPLDTLAHLKELCAAAGLPGHETPLRQIVRSAWAPLTDELHEDRLGSLWAWRRGQGDEPRPRLMLAAHMDAIGLMVTEIEGDFLRVTNLGGIDVRVLPGQLVTVHGREDLPAVVALPPAFLLPKNQRDNFPPLGELLVDTGLPEAELRERVQLGDLVSFAQPPRELLNGHLTAKSLDNRASLAAVTVCLEALQQRAHAWDIVAVATVQEETGLRGASGAAFGLEPDLAVAIDVTFGIDWATREFAYQSMPLGGGPALGLGPNIHPGMHAAFKAAAERAEIAFSIEPMPAHSGTDAFAIQIARQGVPTMVVSIPLRNMHTPVEVVAIKDISRTGRLLAEFAASLQPDFLLGLSLD
jgi:tetrahedral aminopeptidase